MWLDICTDKDCAEVESSVPFIRCKTHKTADPAIVNVSECLVNTVVSPENSFPDPTLLNHPAYMRVRVDNLQSSPLYFSGGKASNPTTLYPFTITVTLTGLQVTPEK